MKRGVRDAQVLVAFDLMQVGLCVVMGRCAVFCCVLCGASRRPCVAQVSRASFGCGLAAVPAVELLFKPGMEDDDAASSAVG